MSASDFVDHPRNTFLKLEEIDRNLFRSNEQWRMVNSKRVYGGQVVGQGLIAACNTVPSPNFHVHSLHCYFIRMGQNDRPILYQVDCTRDGRSFCTRSVKAIQGGECLLAMLVSFQKNEIHVIDYQTKMPKVVPPDDLQSMEELLDMALRAVSGSEKLHNKLSGAKRTAEEIPLELRPVDPTAYFSQKNTEPKIYMWIKTKVPVGSADDNLQRCVAAYISDWVLLRTALIPYPNFNAKMVASLDHTMWFHCNFSTDEWMLYECECPRMVGGRALVQGRMWRQDGTLAVSVLQEGLIRGSFVESKL